MEEEIKKLEENIKKWREELKDWEVKGRNTDAMIEAKRSLNNLIFNAQRRIKELSEKSELTPDKEKKTTESENTKESKKNNTQNTKPKERKEDPAKKSIKNVEKKKLKKQQTNSPKVYTNQEKTDITPEELLEQLKNGVENLTRQKTELMLSIEKLEDEKKAYESEKNTTYKDIYQEYENAIQKKKEELENLEKNEIEGKNKKIRILTQGKMMQEEKITEIKKKIESKQREIKNIQYGTEKAMQDKKLKDGTNAKVPKVFEQYKQLFKLQEELEKEIAKQNEYQTYINQLKGIEKEEKPNHTQQMEEYTKFFHGKGDIPENKRDDQRANDEYFGFEKNRKLKPEEPTNPTEPKLKEPKILAEKNPKEIGEPEELMPTRSFWEIYNDTCTEHIGSIEHNIYKMAHMSILPPKKEDVLHKVLSGVLIPLKAPMKLLAKIPSKIMKTNEKIEEMKTKVDNLSSLDFQVLVQPPERVNKMFNEHIKDTFDRDYLDPQFMKQYKVNGAYLDVVRSRLGREYGTAIDFYTTQANKSYEKMQALEKVGQDKWTLEQANEYNQATEIYQKNVEEGKKLQEQLDTFDEGAKKKSSAYRNISGWFLGKFNPDNREENAKMANLSQKRRLAARSGDRTGVNVLTGQMQRLGRENTMLQGGEKNYIDTGNYSIESPVEALDRGPQTKGRLLLTDVALISAATGLFNQIANNRINQQAVQTHNQHLTEINQSNQSIEVNGEAHVSDSPTASEVEDTITRQTVEAGWNRAERGDLGGTNWGFTNDYVSKDIQSHAEGAQTAMTADAYLQQGNHLEALKTATDYYTKVQKANRDAIATYMGTHPQHDYTAFTFGDSADMAKVYEFFKSGVVPYHTNINGIMAEMMPKLKDGIDLNGIIFTGANALYQAQKESMRDLRKQLRNHVSPTAEKKNEEKTEERMNDVSTKVTEVSADKKEENTETR